MGGLPLSCCSALLATSLPAFFAFHWRLTATAAVKSFWVLGFIGWRSGGRRGIRGVVWRFLW